MVSPPPQWPSEQLTFGPLRARVVACSEPSRLGTEDDLVEEVPTMPPPHFVLMQLLCLAKSKQHVVKQLPQRVGGCLSPGLSRGPGPGI